MDVYRPLRAGLFFYECLRLLLLVVLLLVLPMESAVNGAFFPYLVYLSPNALFPLMALFVWLRPGEYRNYLSLYMAGKTIAVFLFYAWEIFSSREFPGAEHIARSVTLFGGSIFITVMDLISVGGLLALYNKFRQIYPAIDSGGRAGSGGV